MVEKHNINAFIESVWRSCKNNEQREVFLDWIIHLNKKKILRKDLSMVYILKWVNKK